MSSSGLKAFSYLLLHHLGCFSIYHLRLYSVEAEEIRVFILFWYCRLCKIMIDIFPSIFHISIRKLYHFSFTNFSLALVDSLLLLDMLIQKTIIPYYTNLSPAEPEWYKLSYPYFWHPFKGVIATVTIYLMVAISAERYRAVCYPLSRRHVSVILEFIIQ